MLVVAVVGGAMVMMVVVFIETLLKFGNWVVDNSRERFLRAL